MAKLTAGDAAEKHEFGSSVAVDGDTVVVGAWQIGDSYSKTEGAVYIFRAASDATYTQVRKLTASDPGATDAFGTSVAIDSDTIVVGAKYDDAPLSRSGSAYVFRTTNGGASWYQVAKLTAHDAQRNDYFGWSVAIAGDSILVGAIWDQFSVIEDDDKIGYGNKQGSVYVFSRTTYGFVTKLKAADPAEDDEFGISVAINGDTIAITGGGSVYIFRTNDGGAPYGQVAKLTADDGVWLGYVAIAGDVVVAGAPFDDSIATNAGAVYVFHTRDGGATYVEVAKLAAADVAYGDSFGVSVAIDGNFVAVGAPGCHGSFNGRGCSTLATGAVVIFRISDGGRTYCQVAKLKATDAAARDYFGYSVAVNDGTVVIGAYGDNDAGSNSGSAYVFELPENDADDSCSGLPESLVFGSGSGSLGGGDSKKQCRTAYGSTEAGFLWLFLVLSIFSCAFCCYGIVRDLDDFNEDTKNLWALNFCFLFVFFILVIVMAVILPETCTTTPPAPPSPPTLYPTASFAPTTAAPTTPSPSTPHPTLSFAPTITAAPTASPTTAAPSSASTAAPGTLGALIICSVAAAVTLIFAAYVSCIKVKVYGKNRDDAVSMTSLAVFGLAALDFYSDAYFAYSAFQSKQPIVSTLGKVMIGWLVVIIAVDGWLLVEVKREHQLATNESDKPFDEAHSGTFLIIFLLTCTSAELIAAFPWEDAKANGFPDGNVEFCGFWGNSVEKWAERAGWLEDFPQLALECAVFIIQGGADGQEELFFCTIITFLAMIVRCILRRVLPRERDS